MALSQEQITLLKKALLDAVQRNGSTRGLSGADSGEIIRQAFPGTRIKDHGYRNLREFIEREIPELKIIGQSGLDPVYGLTSWNSTLPQRNRVFEPSTELWRIWVSPRSTQRLAVDRSTGGIRVVEGSASLNEHEAGVSPPEARIHRQIAADFLSSKELTDEMQASLQRCLDEESEDWWKGWNDTLRGSATGYEWFEFRQQALEKAFERKLSVEGLSKEAVETALKALREARERARAMLKTSGAPVSTGFSERRARGDLSHHAALVARVLKLIPRMSEEELRSLRLPLGLVLDALDDSRRG